MIRHIKSAARLLPLVLVFLTTGCGRNWKLVIESNTQWSGTYGSVTGRSWSTADVEGRGDRTIDLHDDDRVCASFIQRGDGYLRLTLKDTGGGPFHLLAEDSRSVESNVRFGQVDLCSEGTIPR